jgi:hypothetical protein
MSILQGKRWALLGGRTLPRRSNQYELREALNRCLSRDSTRYGDLSV